MQRIRVLLGGLILLVAVVGGAGYLMKGRTKQSDNGDGASKTPPAGYVANFDVPAGAIVNPAWFSLGKTGDNAPKPPPNAVTKLEDIQYRQLKRPLQKGDYVTSDHLSADSYELAADEVKQAPAGVFVVALPAPADHLASMNLAAGETVTAMPAGAGPRISNVEVVRALPPSNGSAAEVLVLLRQDQLDQMGDIAQVSSFTFARPKIAMGGVDGGETGTGIVEVSTDDEGEGIQELTGEEGDESEDADEEGETRPKKKVGVGILDLIPEPYGDRKRKSGSSTIFNPKLMPPQTKPQPQPKPTVRRTIPPPPKLDKLPKIGGGASGQGPGTPKEKPILKVHLIKGSEETEVAVPKP